MQQPKNRDERRHARCVAAVFSGCQVITVHYPNLPTQAAHRLQPSSGWLGQALCAARNQGAQQSRLVRRSCCREPPGWPERSSSCRAAACRKMASSPMKQRGRGLMMVENNSSTNTAVAGVLQNLINPLRAIACCRRQLAMTLAGAFRKRWNFRPSFRYPLNEFQGFYKTLKGLAFYSRSLWKKSPKVTKELLPHHSGTSPRLGTLPRHRLESVGRHVPSMARGG